MEHDYFGNTILDVSYDIYALNQRLSFASLIQFIIVSI